MTLAKISVSDYACNVEAKIMKYTHSPKDI